MISYRIVGIPCLIDVVSVDYSPGSYSYNAASDVDHYGYCEIEYTVHDRKGYKAPWLARKVTDKINKEIESMILDNYFSKTKMYDYD